MDILSKRRRSVWLAALIVSANGFFPAIWVLLTSFKTESELMRVPITIWPAAATLDNYVRVFVDQPIGQFLLNSIAVATASTLLCVAVSSLAAYALVRMRLPASGLILSAHS
jgi:multiple sugar transport system permease protein